MPVHGMSPNFYIQLRRGEADGLSAQQALAAANSVVYYNSITKQQFLLRADQRAPWEPVTSTAYLDDRKAYERNRSKELNRI